MRFRRLFVAALAVLTLSSCRVAADIIVSLPTTDTTPFAPGFQTFTYTADLTNDEKLRPGNFFTIYDIPGLFTASGPTGWTASASLLGQTPPTSNPPDNATLLNVTFTDYGIFTDAGPRNLGDFLITTDAAHAMTANGYFASEATEASGFQAGMPIDNVGTLPVPSGDVSAAPLPLALWSACPLMLAALFYRSRLIPKRV
jgi:hypothetical protein